MKLHHNYLVYIVECKDNFYYTGVTNDLDRRDFGNTIPASIKNVTHTSAARWN